MCHSSLSVLNPKYRSLIKEGALTLDDVVQLPDSRILVPCGHCSACRRQKALTWRGRLLREYDDFCENGGYRTDGIVNTAPVYFVTLTVSNKWRPLVEDSPSKIMRWFFENLRFLTKDKKSLRHWFIVEYGDYVKHTGRIHFHGLFFGLNGLSFSDIRRAWLFGRRVDISRVRSRACMTYVTKYVTKGNAHALVYARTGRFPHLSKIYSSPALGTTLYSDRESDIVRSAQSAGPITVSYKNFSYSVPYYYISKYCNKRSEKILTQRRIINAFLRKLSGWARYFGLDAGCTGVSAANFASGILFLPQRLRHYARLALLESNPDPPSELFARREVRSLLKTLDCYEYDHCRPPRALSELQCALGKV